MLREAGFDGVAAFDRTEQVGGWVGGGVGGGGGGGGEDVVGLAAPPCLVAMAVPERPSAHSTCLAA